MLLFNLEVFRGKLVDFFLIISLKCLYSFVLKGNCHPDTFVRENIVIASRGCVRLKISINIM